MNQRRYAIFMIALVLTSGCGLNFRTSVVYPNGLGRDIASIVTQAATSTISIDGDTFTGLGIPIKGRIRIPIQEIENPHYCDVFFFEDRVVDLGPGERFTGVGGLMPFPQRMGIMWRCYEDPEHTKYLSAFGELRDLDVRYPSVKPIIISRRQLIFAQSGFYGQNEAMAVRDLPHPRPDRWALIQRQAVNSTLVIQAINNTTGGLRMHVYIHGVEDKSSVDLDGFVAGEFFATHKFNTIIGGGNDSVTIEFIFKDGDLPVKCARYYASVPYAGVDTAQYIVSDWDIRNCDSRY